MNLILSGRASKAVAGLAGAAAILLSHYAHLWWEPSALAGLTAVTVYLVPNVGPSAPPEPPAEPPSPMQGL